MLPAPSPRAAADLVFVHLSDIHFQKGRVGTKHDSDEELRGELVTDLRALAPTFSPVSGILVTGDIAWGGHPKEFAYADSWLRSVADQLRCEHDAIMVTPGNHDVYRPALLYKGKQLTRLHRSVRTGANPDVCVARLTRALSGTTAQLYAKPLQAYNVFAKAFRCDITPDDPYWERAFTLGDGSSLVLRGITSTWLSGPTDSERVARLLYGSAQYTFTRKPGVEYIVAGHHPPQNMIDGDEASKAFDFHCKLQLFGHKHNQWITRSPSGARLVAGALHPDRREKPWIPRYNIITVTAELTETNRLIHISIYPRRWSDEFRVFMADYTPNAENVRMLRFPT